MSEQLPYIEYQPGDARACVVFSYAPSVKVSELFPSIQMKLNEETGADNTVTYSIDEQGNLVDVSFQLLDVDKGAPTANLAGLGFNKLFPSRRRLEIISLLRSKSIKVASIRPISLIRRSEAEMA